tara:strand:+ start:309 stop:491 length:183 start_codon:yes stop_codon:yes gene_type:complete
MGDKIEMSLDLANQIMGYLGRQPYEQVFSLIQRMQDEHKAFVESKATIQTVEAKDGNDGN